LAEKFGMTPVQVTAMVRRLEQRDLSLDTKVYDDAGTTIGDTLPAVEPDHAETLAADELGDIVRDAVRTAVDDLDPRERYIVEHRIMADREDELSLAEIGRRLGVSRERARQLEARAKKKLKSRITQISRQSGTPLSELDTAA
jgi:RNA polymerase sigma-32 factor